MSSTGPNRVSKRATWTFVAAAFVFAFAGQWVRGLWETDEGRYSECARAMVATGDWLHPTLHGRFHPTKPPGAYWLIAAGLELFGRNEFGARFFLGAAFACSALLVRMIGRDLLGAAAGSRAGWIFLAMLLPVASGNTVSTDMFLLAFGLASIACMVRSWTSERPGAWLAASGAALGLAFFVKGPPALLPWGGAVAGWFLGTRKALPRSRAVSVAGVALFLGLGLWWFCVMVAEDPGRMDYWLRSEVYERVLTNAHHRDKPFWFYPAVIVGGTLPWTWLVARGLARSAADATGRLLLAWFAIPFAVFALSTSKMWFYLLPLTVPAALLAARAGRRGDDPLPVRAPLLAGWLVLVAGLRTAVAFVPDDRDTKQLHDLVRRLEPTGRLPVALLSGRDMWGLEFQFDGALRYLSDPREVETGHADATLAEEFALRRSRGEDWIAIVEPGSAERAMARVVGGAAQTLSSTDDWHIYRVRGR